MLHALLGEMHYIPNNAQSYVHLDRSKGVAYVAQESWVISDTVRVSSLLGCAVQRCPK